MSKIKTTFKPKGQKVEKLPSGEIEVESNIPTQPVDPKQTSEFKGTTYSMFRTYSINSARSMRHY